MQGTSHHPGYLSTIPGYPYSPHPSFSPREKGWSMRLRTLSHTGEGLVYASQDPSQPWENWLVYAPHGPPSMGELAGLCASWSLIPRLVGRHVHRVVHILLLVGRHVHRVVPLSLRLVGRHIPGGYLSLRLVGRHIAVCTPLSTRFTVGRYPRV